MTHSSEIPSHLQVIPTKRTDTPTSVIPSHSTAVSRTILIVSTPATFDQWCVSAERTLKAVAPMNFAQFHACSGDSRAWRLFKEMAATPDVPRVAVLTATGLTQYFAKYYHVGCAVLVVDEISTHARSLPTGTNFGGKPFPSVYRMIGLSATVRAGSAFLRSRQRPR